MNMETKISAITPLEEAVDVLFQKIQQLEVNIANIQQKLKEIQKDYQQRREDVRKFLGEHSYKSNPWGFSDEEIKDFSQRAERLNCKLDMIGLLLDMKLMSSSSQLMLGVLGCYLKQPCITSVHDAVKAFNTIECPALREVLKNIASDKQETYWQAYPLTEIYKTLDLLKKYFQLPLKDQYYNSFFSFLIKNQAVWIPPINKETFERVLQPQLPVEIPVNNTSASSQLKEIDREINTLKLLEFQIVSPEEKTETLHKIQDLKSKLSNISKDNYLEYIYLLQEKLDDIFHKLMPLLPESRRITV